MLLHSLHGPSSYVVSVKPHSFAASVDGSHVVAWDRGGRLYSVFKDGVTWRRGLSGALVEKRRAGGERVHAWPSGADADRVVDEAAGVARSIRDGMAGSGWTWTGPADPAAVEEARALIGLAARFDAAAARADARRCRLVLGHIGILPPDQYLSLALQATEGCAFNTCTFCDLYQDGFRVKTPEEFREHAGGVLACLGASAMLRSRGVFLGAANALALPMARLVPIFRVLLDEVEAARRGVSAFVDAFTGARKTAGDYRVLGRLGLRRVYVGLESGHDPLLSFVRKPGTAAGAIDTVRAIKAAGVSAGVIVMIGLGGDRFAEGHERDTISALNAMGLGSGDLLYFSDLVEVPAASYPRQASEAGIRPLDSAGRRAQQARIRSALRFPGTPPRLAAYDIREFTY